MQYFSMSSSFNSAIDKIYKFQFLSFIIVFHIHQMRSLASVETDYKDIQHSAVKVRMGINYRIKIIIFMYKKVSGYTEQKQHIEVKGQVPT